LLNTNPPLPKRGEVWLVNFDPTIGAEIKKIRPAIVISSDAVGKLPIKLVAPITDWKASYRQNLWHIRIDPDSFNGLMKASAVDALQYSILGNYPLLWRASMRDMLFLSHANPEDNEFTRWLALQLAREEYPVWCDLTKLLGGEDFWRDIEHAIRERTVKFLYVLSKTSNAKLGPLQELQVAQNVMRDHNLCDFIVPLLIDDLPPRQINIQMARINAILFSQGWAKGLKSLLDKLEQDNISKSAKFTPSAVASWWRTQFSADGGISSQPEGYLSNWFPVRALPQNIYFHSLKGSGFGKLKMQDELPYPAFQHNQYLVSFAQADDFDGKLGGLISISNSHSFYTRDFLDGKVRKNFVYRKQARDFVSHLLRIGWEGMLKERGLPTYELANDVCCFYFTNGLVENNKIPFIGIGGKTTFRHVVGYKSVNTSGSQAESQRFWHFGIQAKPLIYPTLAYIIKPHVVFSDDGSQIWDSKERLHKARRSQCRNWWNPDWRDRILAAMTWLANKNGKIEIQLGNNIVVQVSSYPLTFTSPVSYADPEVDEPLIADDEEDDESGYELDENELDENDRDEE